MDDEDYDPIETEIPLSYPGFNVDIIVDEKTDNYSLEFELFNSQPNNLIKYLNHKLKKSGFGLKESANSNYFFDMERIYDIDNHSLNPVNLGIRTYKASSLDTGLDTLIESYNSIDNLLTTPFNYDTTKFKEYIREFDFWELMRTVDESDKRTSEFKPIKDCIKNLEVTLKKRQRIAKENFDMDDYLDLINEIKDNNNNEDYKGFLIMKLRRYSDRLGIDYSRTEEVINNVMQNKHQKNME